MSDILRSPIFPEESLTLTSGNENEIGDTLVPQLPPTALARNSSLEIYVVPTEDTLFVQGFKPVEYELRPPCLLRGLLVLRVLRPTKIKSVVLNFKGVMQTDWPEGIPPKRNVYEESRDIALHSWPFYQADVNYGNHGASIFVPCAGRSSDEALHLSMDHAPSQLSSTQSPNALESASHFAASLIKRATSPLGLSSSPTITPVASFTDLHSVMSSPSVEQPKPGWFMPGDYVYNFEHLIPALSPETIKATFGSVNYCLEAVVSRQGTFKPVLKGKLPIKLVRVPTDNSVEENEPIVIERDWDDHLRYEIVVASKSVVLDSYLPLSLKFIPLHGKVALHRIRVFIIEECNYYCQNKKVHRTEPSRKFLLLEHKASKSHSLLNKDGTIDDSPTSTTEVLPRELEFQMFVPNTINKKFHFQINPDTAVESIQCTHWIKICLRLSRPNPENDGKRKHFEISIDSPIHLYSPLAAHNNTLLPIYEREPEFLPQYAEDAPLSPDVTAIDANHPGSSLNMQLSSCSLLTMVIPKDPSLIEFQHIASPTNIGYAEMDCDVHLSSNLYQPEDESILSKIVAPQAMAYSPLASPCRSPSTRTLAPSTAPPLFSSLGITENTLPPAYDHQNSGLSQSPLALNMNSDPTNSQAINAQSIRDRLNEQLSKSHKKSSNSCQSSFISDSASSKSKDSKNNNSSLNDSFPKDSDSVIGESNESEHMNSSETSRDECKSKNTTELNVSLQNDLGMGDETIDEAHVDRESIVDIADLEPRSRRSSVSLSLYLKAGLNDLHIDQTLPLLAQSTTSVYDTDIPMGTYVEDSVTDLVGVRFDDFHFNDSLGQLRNPRLEKHYQDLATTETLECDRRNRERSFGVVMKES